MEKWKNRKKMEKVDKNDYKSMKKAEISKQTAKNSTVLA